MPSRIADFDEYQMFHPDGQPCGLEEAPLTRSINSGEEVEDEEYFYLLDDGSRLWLRLDSSPIHDEEGRIVAGTLIVRDITGEKRSQERLAYHAGLLENMHDAVLATDEHFVVTAWNRGAEELYGYSAQEALGRNVLEVAPGRTSDEQWGEVLAELEERGRYRVEMDTSHRDGTPLRIEATAVALRGGGGRITGYLATVTRDITERKRYEEELFESEGRLRFVLEAGGLGNWRLDLQTYELTSSENCKANFSLPPDAELSYEKLRS